MIKTVIFSIEIIVIIYAAIVKFSNISYLVGQCIIIVELVRNMSSFFRHREKGSDRNRTLLRLKKDVINK